MADRRAARRAFWDDAINIPNAITMARIVCIPLVLWLVHLGTPRTAVYAAWAWTILSITDALDGYLARKLKVESLVGKFLDPLADKLFVTALLIYLVPMGRISTWIVVALIAREISVTSLRALAGGEGIVIAAGSGGKWKTALQMLGVLCLILHFPHAVVPFYPHPVNLNVVGQWLMLLSLVFSLTSGAEYVALFGDGIAERERQEAAEGEG